MYACLILHLKCCCFDPFMTRLKTPALQVQPPLSDFSTCVCHKCVQECLSSLSHSMQTRSLSLHCLRTCSLSLNVFTFTERVHFHWTCSLSLNVFTFTERVHFHCIVCKHVQTCSLVLHHRELTASLSSYLSISLSINLFLAFNTPLSPVKPYIYMHHFDSFSSLGIQFINNEPTEFTFISMTLLTPHSWSTSFTSGTTLALSFAWCRSGCPPTFMARWCLWVAESASMRMK
jgi:hypothetical protein